jgi:hypothetical protein
MLLLPGPYPGLVFYMPSTKRYNGCASPLSGRFPSMVERYIEGRTGNWR